MLACAAATALLVLTVVVRLGVTRPLDAAVRQWARPDDVWGSLQIRADVIVEGLRPTSTLLLTAVVVAAVGLGRRSVRPVLVTAGTALLMIAVTVGLKLLLHRPDPHGALSDHGGSFPSGHTVTVVVCTGLLTLMLVPDRHRWRWLVPLLLGPLMGVALLLQAAHWLTDVVGGALVGVTILATVTALGARQWWHGVPQPARSRGPADGEPEPDAAGPRVPGDHPDPDYAALAKTSSSDSPNGSGVGAPPRRQTPRRPR